MHEFQALEELGAELLVKIDGQLVGGEDGPQQLRSATGAAPRRRLAHQGKADAVAPYRRVDPEVDDEHDPRRPVDIIAEVIEEVAAGIAVAFGDDAGKRRVRAEAVAQDGLDAEILLVGVAEIAQIAAEIPPHARKRLGILRRDVANTKPGGVAHRAAFSKRARGWALS